jgi:hypothetical protein
VAGYHFEREEMLAAVLRLKADRRVFDANDGGAHHEREALGKPRAVHLPRGLSGGQRVRRRRVDGVRALLGGSNSQQLLALELLFIGGGVGIGRRSGVGLADLAGLCRRDGA